MSRYIYTRPLCTYATQLIVTYIHTNRCIYIYIHAYTNIYIHVYILRYIHMRPLCMCRPLCIHTQHNSFSLQSTPRKRTLEVTHMNSRAVRIQVLLQLPVDSPNVDDGWSLITYTYMYIHIIHICIHIRIYVYIYLYVYPTLENSTYIHIMGWLRIVGSSKL